MKPTPAPNLTSTTYDTFMQAWDALKAAGYTHKPAAYFSAGQAGNANWRYEYGLCEARIDYSKQHGGYRITERA